MGHFRTAAITGALLLAGLTPVIAQTESCTVPARQILENPSFETGSLAPWEAVNTCASCGGMPEIVEDKENAHDGSWVFRQAFYDNIVWHASQPVAIESPGEPHNISLWYRYDALPGITVDYCGIRVRYGTTPLQNIGSSFTDPDAGWTQLSATWIPTATEYTFYVAYGCNYTTLYLDDIQLWAPERETTCSTSTTTSTSTTVTSSSTSTPTTPPTTSSSTTTSVTSSTSTTTSSTTSITSSSITTSSTTFSTTSSSSISTTSTFTTTTKPTCNPQHTETVTRTKTVTVTACPTSLPRYFECLAGGIHHH
ncbi:hypothetical protein ASPBRDRAFT_47746 [Aspergillus brasiliensis CBS 101740]|uniref:CBM-cenC domain-containing protein n=1 Tax=Aspergillus brasiliensis (strain CBS 101740 / IMI 381727 / IBT 21946) TaxID=767769 RepID=A0A1L9U7V5_ASPBC|nr:hypothetical protein ASPBRDRAFT_47746 [Aspergillus brasiliensis CBS 101740]